MLSCFLSCLPPPIYHPRPAGGKNDRQKYSDRRKPVLIQREDSLAVEARHLFAGLKIFETSDPATRIMAKLKADALMIGRRRRPHVEDDSSECFNPARERKCSYYVYDVMVPVH